MARQTPRSVVAGRVVLPPLPGSATLVSCPRNSRYIAGGQLAVFQGASEAPISERKMVRDAPLMPVRLGPPCRRPILIATICLLFRGQDTSTSLHRSQNPERFVSDAGCSLRWRKRRLAVTTTNLMPVFAHQADVSNRIAKGSDFAAFIRVDCSNRHKADSEPLVYSQNYTLTLKLKPVFSRQQNWQQFFTHEPEPTLAIGKPHFTNFTDLPGHELIGPSANERH